MRTGEIITLSAETRHYLTKAEELLDALTGIGCEKPSVLADFAEPIAAFRPHLDALYAELQKLAAEQGIDPD